MPYSAGSLTYVMATKSSTWTKRAILWQKIPNGVDEGLTLGQPTVVIVACFCRVVWVFWEIFADVTRTIYTLSSTTGDYTYLMNQDELLVMETTVH